MPCSRVCRHPRGRHWGRGDDFGAAGMEWGQGHSTLLPSRITHWKTTDTGMHALYRFYYYLYMAVDHQNGVQKDYIGPGRLWQARGSRRSFLVGGRACQQNNIAGGAAGAIFMGEPASTHRTLNSPPRCPHDTLQRTSSNMRPARPAPGC